MQGLEKLSRSNTADISGGATLILVASMEMKTLSPTTRATTRATMTRTTKMKTTTMTAMKTVTATKIRATMALLQLILSMERNATVKNQTTYSRRTIMTIKSLIRPMTRHARHK